MLVLILFVLALTVAMTAAIARKAGFSGWWGVTAIIPLVNLIMIWVFAFVDWGEPRQPRGRKEEKIISAWD